VIEVCIYEPTNGGIISFPFGYRRMTVMAQAGADRLVAVRGIRSQMPPLTSALSKLNAQSTTPHRRTSPSAHAGWQANNKQILM